MNIVFETTWLAPGGAMAASDVRVNGAQLIDDAAFFRASTMAFYPRGDRSVTLTFTTKWIFNTTTAAEVFALMLPTMSPLTVNDLGVLQCICGSDPNTQTVYMDNAVLESVSVVRQIGLSLEVAYVVKGPGFQTAVPPDVPGYPNPNEVAPVLRRDSVAIAAAATSVVVTFSSPFQTTPIVVATCTGVSGSVGIFARVLSDSVSTTGFTAELSYTTPDTSYKLNYIAMQ